MTAWPRTCILLAAGSRESGAGRSGSMPHGYRRYSVAEKEKAVRRVRAGKTMHAGDAVSWDLVGDMLILRIPLGRVARRIAALKVLAASKREMGR